MQHNIEFSLTFAQAEQKYISNSPLLKSWLQRNQDFEKTNQLLIYGAEYDEVSNRLDILRLRIHTSREWRWGRDKSGTNFVIERSKTLVLPRIKIIGRNKFYYVFSKTFNQATQRSDCKLLSDYVDDDNSSRTTATNIIESFFGKKPDVVKMISVISPEHNNTSMSRIYLAEFECVKWVLDDPDLEFVQEEYLEDFVAQHPNNFIVTTYLSLSKVLNYKNDLK